MMTQTLRILATVSVIVLLQAGCATNGPKAETSHAAISVSGQQLLKTTRSWDGDLLPAYPSGQPEITIARVTIPPGDRLETHSHPVINAGVLLTGQLTVVKTDGGTLDLKAGDPICEVVNKPHYGFNSGTVPAEIMVVYAGTVGVPVEVLEANKHQ